MKTGTEKTLVEQRLSGIRPEVEIAGIAYIFYLEEMQLRPKILSRMTRGNITLLDHDKCKDGYRFLLNKDTGERLATIPADSLAFPENVLIVEIPFPVAIDPVGFARKHGISSEQLLKLYPIQNTIQAKIIPWQTTRFTRLIEENNWARDREQKEKVQRKIAAGSYQAKREKRAIKKNKGKHP